MSFDWNLYILMAGEFVKKYDNPKYEHYLRTAISRAYYGVFGEFAGLLKAHGYEISKTDTHKDLRKTILRVGEHKSEGSKIILKKIVTDIFRLWADRKDADYNGNVTIGCKKAQESYLMAVKIKKKYVDLEKLLLPS